MAKRKPTLVDNLLRYWPIYGIGVTLCGTLVLWASIPGRLAKAEDQIDDLKGWARELQGYTRANQQMMQQQNTDIQNPPVRHDRLPPSPGIPVKAGLERTCFDDQWQETPCP